LADERDGEERIGLSPTTSRKVIDAIEKSIPLYDEINDLISFGKAKLSRQFAIQELHLTDGTVILDAGIGPGATSKLILQECNPSLLVGFDASAKQLKTAKLNLKETSQDLNLQLVRGSFEFLPFRDRIFDTIITCYALRDSLNIFHAIEEYHRVCGESGAFADVDLGKPDNPIKRLGSILYVRYVMPFIAKVLILGRIRGNPWRMIGPTYKPLPTNSVLLSKIQTLYQTVDFREFLAGGVIIIVGRKLASS